MDGRRYIQIQHIIYRLHIFHYHHCTLSSKQKFNGFLAKIKTQRFEKGIIKTALNEKKEFFFVYISDS